MLSLMAIVEVVRRVPSLLIMSRRSRRVRPFFGEGALGVVWGVAAAGAGFAGGVGAFLLAFLATWAHVDGAGAVGTGGGGGGGVGVAAAGAGVFALRSLNALWCVAARLFAVARSALSCLISARVCFLKLPISWRRAESSGAGLEEPR
jgi:hypothetical protein